MQNLAHVISLELAQEFFSSYAVLIIQFLEAEVTLAALHNLLKFKVH